MRKIMNFLLCVLVLTKLIVTIHASGGIYVNTSSLFIVKGGSASFRVSASNAAGKIEIYSNNTSVARVSTSSSFLDNDSLTVTVSAVNNGSATITVKIADATTYDYDDLSGKTMTISVNVYTPLSGDASLKTLTLGELEVEALSAAEYQAYAPKGFESVDIMIEPQSSKASVSEIDKTLVEGWNDKSFTIQAENGNSNTYKLMIYVEETPTVIYNEKLGVVKNLDKLEAPLGFEKEEIIIAENTLNIYNHGSIDLIYLVNENEEKDFYLYDRATNTVSNVYHPAVIGNKRYLPLEINEEEFAEYYLQHEATTQIIDGVTFNGWKYKALNMDEYRILYMMDEEGDKRVFNYDIKENTLQRYTLPIYPEVEDYSQLYMIIGISSGIAGLLAVIISMIYSANKIKKN